MRLHKLWIHEYLNLRDLEILFNNDSPSRYGSTNIRFFVGTNGSGKSNALEAFGLIFGHLARMQVPDLDFDLEYTMGNQAIRITNQLDRDPVIRRFCKNLDAAVLVKPASEAGWNESHLQLDWAPDSATFPARVVGYSTGPTSGLAGALVQSAERYLRENYHAQMLEIGLQADDPRQIEASLRESLDAELGSILDNPTSLFLDSSDALFAVLSLLLFDENHIQGPFADCRRILLEKVGLDQTQPLLSFSICMSRDRLSSLTDSARELIQTCMGLAAASRDRAGNQTFDPWSLRLVFDVTEGLRTSLLSIFGTPRELFERLLGWKRRGALSSPALVLNKDGVGDVLLDASLSDGEFLMLGRYAVLVHMRELPHVLVLLDEPETHFNDAWKVDLVKDIRDLLDVTEAGTDGRLYESDVIIATHSDLTLTDAAPTQVYLFAKDGPATSTDASSVTVRSSVVSSFAAGRAEIAREYFKCPQVVGSFAQEIVDSLLKSTNPETIRSHIATMGPGYSRFALMNRLAELEEENADAPAPEET